ncbi:MAG: DUF4358 domain-containing protein [Ruminococcaceae bacterium]|nr:DUF4358 domain-containing protein [Oscillospiraceae bacterium]
MKKILRSTLCLLCVALLLCAVSCDNGGDWKDDLTSASLSTTVKSAFASEDGWETVSSDYISPSAWGEDYADYLALVVDHTITVSAESDMNVDEIGIFRAKNAKDAAKLKKFAESYLQATKLRMAPLLESYNQAELPKLDCADVKVCGNYVLYTILSAEDTAAAQSAFEKALQIKSAD